MATEALLLVKSGAAEVMVKSVKSLFVKNFVIYHFYQVTVFYLVKKLVDFGYLRLFVHYLGQKP